MGFNGEVLVGRGEAFISALSQFWNWEEEVSADWPLRDGWRAVHVRTPAFGERTGRVRACGASRPGLRRT
ncbi:hypothetical protein [Catenulispora subtropica]|uniref:hypothetical protein n=1 Tax=Catenulispora subtropica TaxID=450798 RepID=UPI0031E0C9DF